jgi:hypothetical protein
LRALARVSSSRADLMRAATASFKLVAPSSVSFRV